MNKSFDYFEKWMLIGSILGIIASNMNYFSVEFFDGSTQKMGSLLQYGGFFYIVPLIAVIVLVFLHLDQLSLVASLIELALTVYLWIFVNPADASNYFCDGVRGLGWYVWLIAIALLVAGALLNYTSKKGNS